MSTPIADVDLRASHDHAPRPPPAQHHNSPGRTAYPVTCERYHEAARIEPVVPILTLTPSVR
ncbi:hypothetical protein FB451DRAFT_1396253 [Mycena latifolia]|nr:hypothetical protein FB451DRAFT_1396253 [Mycena latifolia]